MTRVIRIDGPTRVQVQWSVDYEGYIDFPTLGLESAEDVVIEEFEKLMKNDEITVHKEHKPEFFGCQAQRVGLSQEQ